MTFNADQLFAALDRYGVAAVILALAALFLYKGAWPWWVRRQEAADQFLKEQIADSKRALAEQVAAARSARQEDQDKFLAALERRDRLAEEQTKVFAEALRRGDERRGGRS
jgi:hypothetical protein